MNNNINIAEILKDCPKGMELYSPIYGTVELLKVDSNSEYSIKTVTSIDRPASFTPYGRLYENYPSAECLLFPSREMQDWTKLFKRGDVVWSKTSGMYVIFEDWANDDYTEFNTTINCYKDSPLFSTKMVCYTNNCVKVSDEERVKFIADIEKHYRGKYNSDTLWVEQPVKFECPFKPFDKVLVRNDPNQKWTIDMFSYYNRKDNNYPYICVGNHYCYCIPYTKQTAHLIGTKDNN